LNEVGLGFFLNAMFVLKIERKDKVFLVKWDSIKKHVGNKETSNGCGSWIQNVGMQKMKLLMFKCP
jgi:hypothetical protein